jgi:hypothetical protein
MGWLKNVEIRDDGQLWGEVEWTDAGAAAVGHRRYQFFSTEYDARDLEDLGGGRVRPRRLAGLALTNRPNNKGGRPISNRTASGPHQEPRTKNQEQADMKTIAKKLGLPEDADEAAILDRLTELLAENDTLKTRAGEAEVEGILNRHAARIPEGKREDWRKALLANRATAEPLLAGLPEHREAPTENREPAPRLTNRETARTPDPARALGAPESPDGEAQRSAAIRNRAHAIARAEGIQWDAAWNRAKAELAA